MASSSNGKQVLLLPFGYRFFPSNDQVLHYLKQKILGGQLPSDIIPTIDVHGVDPDQLPLSEFKYGVAGEWFFFTTRPAGDLLTEDGYWLPEDLPTEIEVDKRIIGFKQFMAFYKGVFPHGTKSNWTIYEFRLNPDVLEADQADDEHDQADDEHTKPKVQNFVVCRIRNSDKFQETSEWFTNENEVLVASPENDSNEDQNHVNGY
ncbi:hypothetical protein ACH5RR_010595 [Cinchona calisaya]|uniref:NAC domain-containing protein n=1 Tax=Cinchona calisaya TaxID=153742 RepID=A0ABD3AJH2_9GENT